MKKILPLLFTMIFLASCEDSDPIEITVNNVINESISVNVPQTNGIPLEYDQTTTQDLSQIVSNFSSISSINIDTLQYQFTNVTGNTNALLQSAVIVIQGNEIASMSNVNIADLAANGAVYSITDQAILNQLELDLLNNNSLIIQFSGTAISEEGAVDFQIEVSIEITATL